MKGFYLAVVAVVVIGIGWLVYQARSKPPEGLGTEAPIPAATDGFRGYTMGNDSAPVKITEYSDFECPYCAAFATVQMPVVRQQLIATGRVLWRYRDFPLSIHKYSRLAALSGQCAGEQGKFWDMHDQLFGHHDWAQRDKDPTDVFRGFAQAIGLDLARYDDCMKTRRYAGRIQASLDEGEALSIRGTPTFFINGRHYEGHATSDDFKAIVDSLSAARRKG